MGITKDKGNFAEAKVLTFLIQKGYNVSLPWSENSKYDLVAEKNGKFLKVQVKYVSPRNGCIHVPLRSVNNWSIIKFTKEDVDLIAAYNPDNDIIYFIPRAMFKNTTAINLRIDGAKNNQKEKIIHAGNFENILPTT